MHNTWHTLFVGHIVFAFEELTSTNDFAAQLIQKGAVAEGSMVTAGRQTAGRGQLGTVWQSEPHQNLTLSIVLLPNFVLAQEQFILNKAIALGVRDAVAEFCSKSVSIKWPNDIYIENRKVAGILIQNSLKGNTLQHSIVGIGLNVNQTHFGDLSSATSLALELGRSLELLDVRQCLCHHIEARYLQLKMNKREMLHTAFLQKMYRFGKLSFFQDSFQNTWEGRIVGVSDIGKLQIEKEGNTLEFEIKEIKFV